MGNENADSVNLPNNIQKKDISLRKRMIMIDLMVPTVVIFAFLGEWAFTVFVILILCITGWEFWRIYSKDGYSPSLVLMLVFIASAVVMRTLWGFIFVDLWLAGLILSAMLIHVISQQRGDSKAASSFAVTISGAVYLGWLGSYAVSLRSLDAGLFWVLLVFPIIALADSGAYVFGRLLGKHKMLTRVSPKKSWEGYFGGVIIGGLGGWGLAALWNIATGGILPADGLILGIVISILAPIGDFGESMIKRQFCVKDSSNILPGHGGIFDRVDSSLWAAIIGYYVIQLIK
ncbi:MAG: phosphatidate cytidylyltransferase [Chloroflexi bacterium]|nr:phosphatidate cytidylyltransferase [Chloroflexota bacterium]